MAVLVPAVAVPAVPAVAFIRLGVDRAFEAGAAIGVVVCVRVVDVDITVANKPASVAVIDVLADAVLVPVVVYPDDRDSVVVHMDRLAGADAADLS